MRVLVVKTSSMGDVLHTLPALTDAWRIMPSLQFDWVVEEGFAQIPGWHPAVNNVIPVAIRRWRKNWFSAAVRKERRQFRERLRQTHYDAVIDGQGLLKSALLVTRLAHGPRHGYDWHSAREPLASVFYTHRHRVARDQHAITRLRQLFAQSLRYSLPAGSGDYAIAAHFARQTQAGADYLVFLHATTRAEKHWPEASWRQLIEALASTGLQIKLPWGTPAERQRAERLAAGQPHVVVLPRLTLEEVARELSGARAVVSVDTGLSHLAAALDKPNLILYGPTDPNLIGSYGAGQTFLRAPHGDLRNLAASAVLAQLTALLHPAAEVPSD